jgi:hypothetical protein
MTRRELFGLVVMTATGKPKEPEITSTLGPLVDNKLKKPVTEWGQFIDTLMDEVPDNVFAKLEYSLKRTHRAPCRYEVSYVWMTYLERIPK